MALQQYQSDGGYDFGRLWIFISTGLALGIPAAITVEAISFYAECWWPIKGAMLAIYGLVLGGFLHVAGSSAKNRNTTLHNACCLLITVLLFYIQWLAYFNIALWHTAPAGQWPAWVTDPRDVWALVVARAQTGSFATTAPPGIAKTIGELVMWVAWGLEALWVLFLPITVGRDYLLDPFYPQINDWGKKNALPNRYTLPEGITEAQQILADDRFQWLRQLSRTDLPHFLQFEMTEYPEQPVSYFTVTSVSESIDSKGNKTNQRQTLVKNVELSRSQRQEFDQLLKEADERGAGAENLGDHRHDELSDADASDEADADNDPDGEHSDDQETGSNDVTDADSDARPAPAETDKQARRTADPYADRRTPGQDSPAAPPRRPVPPPPRPTGKPEDLWDE